MEKINLYVMMAWGLMTSLGQASSAPLVQTKTASSDKDYQGIYCLCYVQMQQRAQSLAGPLWQSNTVSGFALRAAWSAVEPSKGVYNWTLFDQNLALAKQYNKKISLSVTPGILTPAWVIGEGASYINIAVGNTRVNMPLPWDPVYQQQWSTFIQAEATRYDADSNVSYVTMGGSGGEVETFLITNQADYDTFAATGGLPKWISATESIIDKYAAAFKNTPFVLAMGNPIQNVPSENTAGQMALEQVINYGLTKYPGRFILATHGLSTTSLVKTTWNYWMYQFIMNNEATSPVGFQMIGPATDASAFGGSDTVGNLSVAVSNGIQMGAQFIEVYQADCENSQYTTMLQSANVQLNED